MFVRRLVLVVTVKDTDNGLKALKARLKAGIPAGRVGVYGDLAAQKHKDGNGATVGQIAAAHEFGLGTAPMRPWMRGTLEAHKDQIAHGLTKIVAAQITNEGNPSQMMQQLVLAMAGWCKQTIVAGVAPALGTVSEGAKRYLKKKLERYPGATTALIASGQFLSSIAGEVEK
jgi:hypothetical protein